MCMTGGQTGAGGNAGTDAASGAMAGASMGMLLGPWGAAAGAVGGATMAIIGGNTSRQNAKGVENQKRLERERQINENRKRATEDYLRQTRLEQLQASQERESLAEKSVDIGRQRDLSVGTAVASAAERGVGGRTVDQIVSDYHMQNDIEIGRLNANQTMKNLQHNENMTAYNRQYYNKATSVQPYQMQTQAPTDYFTPIFGAMGNLGKIAMASGVGQGSTLPKSTKTSGTPLYADGE